MCKEMCNHLSMDSQASQVSLHEQVQTMSALHTQLQTTTLVVREYEQELWGTGEDIESDTALVVMLGKLKELLHQIQDLLVEIRRLRHYRKRLS
jgi:hypothetical protein